MLIPVPLLATHRLHFLFSIRACSRPWVSARSFVTNRWPSLTRSISIAIESTALLKPPQAFRVVALECGFDLLAAAFPDATRIRHSDRREDEDGEDGDDARDIHIESVGSRRRGFSGDAAGRAGDQLPGGGDVALELKDALVEHAESRLDPRAVCCRGRLLELFSKILTAIGR